MLIVLFVVVFLLAAFLGHTDEAVNMLKWGGIFLLALPVLFMVAKAVDSFNESSARNERERASIGRPTKNLDTRGLPKYTDGYEYEYFVAAYLAQNGYTSLKVTQRSGDFGADIIGRSPKGYTVAVQCKFYDRPVGYRAVEEAVSGMVYYKCDQAMVVTNTIYTEQTIMAADKMDVILLQGIR